MVTKRRVKEVYVQGTAFTQSELDYINKCLLSIPYSVDVSTATIHIPPAHADTYRDNLHTLHLINQFGFTAQVTIGAEIHATEVFNPAMRSKPTPTVSDTPPITLPKRGEIWVHTESKQRYYFDRIESGAMRVKFLNSLINDKTFKVSDIEFLISRGDLIKEER